MRIRMLVGAVAVALVLTTAACSSGGTSTSLGLDGSPSAPAASPAGTIAASAAPTAACESFKTVYMAFMQQAMVMSKAVTANDLPTLVSSVPPTIAALQTLVPAFPSPQKADITSFVAWTTDLYTGLLTAAQSGDAAAVKAFMTDYPKAREGSASGEAVSTQLSEACPNTDFGFLEQG